MNLGAKMLRKWRTTESWTQAAVADELKLHTQQVSLYESGGKRPGRQNAVKLYKLADIPIDAWDVEDN